MMRANNAQKSSARRGRKTGLFITAVLAVFVTWKSLVVAGFCFSEARFLSEKDLIARYLAGTASNRVGAAWALQQPHFGDCCQIKYQPMFLTGVDLAGNAVIYNRRLYGIEAYLQRLENTQEEEPYMQIHSGIEACGHTMDLDTYNMPIDADLYRMSIDRHRRQREGVL